MCVDSTCQVWVEDCVGPVNREVWFDNAKVVDKVNTTKASDAIERIFLVNLISLSDIPVEPPKTLAPGKYLPRSIQT